MPTITPNLWFDSEGEEAAAFYTGIFPRSSVGQTTTYGPDNPSGKPEGSVMTVEFELDGTSFVAINGGPQFRFTEAVSLEIRCADQAEVDHYWDRLGEGGQHGPCGWLKDRYGLSWQVVPQAWYDLMTSADEASSQRLMQAMLSMGKLDVVPLERAAVG